MLGQRPPAYRGYAWAAVLWAILVFPLSNWGIPDTSDDLILFSTPVWSANQFRAAERLDAIRDERGADVDRNPLEDRGQLQTLTESAAQRAEILTRYRLYSRQPDEMITFRALQQMNPRGMDFDPKLYQYGGIYIYGVGATLVLGHVCGLLTVTGNLDYYLGHPRDFGHFYVAARLLSILGGAVLLVCFARLAAQVAGRGAGWLAMLFVAGSPVFLCGVLEAKPHMPSAAALSGAMLLWTGYLRRPTFSRALLIGSVCGLSFGLVLTGLVGLALCLSLPFVSRPGRSRWLHGVTATLAFGLVFALCNPYLVYNQLLAPETVQSNLGNSTAMYTIGLAGFIRVVELLREGCGLPLLILGVIGWIMLAWRHGRNVALLSSAALGLLLIGGLLGAGKPAEFARFLALPACGLALCSAILLGALTRGQPIFAVLLGGSLIFFTGQGRYIQTFYTDAFAADQRRQMGEEIRRMDIDTLGVVQEPAPYSIPPFNFAERTVVLLPEEPVEPGALPDWLVVTGDGPEQFDDAWWRPYYNERRARRSNTPITWANKDTFLFRKAVGP